VDLAVMLSVIAYNLGNLWRRLVLPKKIENWSLTSLQQRLLKTGGRLVKHARYYWLLLTESHLTRRLFGSMVRRIGSLPLPAGLANRRPEQISAAREAGAGKVSEAQVEGGSVSSFGILRRVNTGPFHGSCKPLALKTQLEIEFRARSGVYCCSGEN